MEYKYGMRLRGFSPMCQPKGVIRREDDPTGKYYDVIVYDRELTSKEINDYELDYINEVRNMNYIILQMPSSNPATFMSTEHLKHLHLEIPKRQDYVRVYSGQIYNAYGSETLNHIYEKLNINHPTDYHARSLSVSDVVGLAVGKDEEGRRQWEWWYVDSIGFKRIWN